MTIVVIAEKLSQAKDIASGMGWSRAGDCFQGSLEGKPVKLVWAAGHLLTLLEPQEAKPDASWKDPDTLTPIPTEFGMKVIPDRVPQKGARGGQQPREYLAAIARHVKAASEVIIATDPDREGEAIGWQILEHVRYRGAVRRAWLAHGLDSASIKKAMRDLKRPDETKSWYRAAEARGRSDWAFQFLVRAYTYYGRHGGLGKHLGSGEKSEGVVSVGRVQTPTLRLVVDRDLEIENFVPQDHFGIKGEFAVNGGAIAADYKPVVTREIIEAQPPGVSWQPSKVVPKEGEEAPLDIPLYTGKREVESFKARLMGAAEKGVVRAFSKKNRQESPPMPYNLSAIQGDLNKTLGLTAAQAQALVEGLYQKGIVSYPRTENPELPRSMYNPEERNPVLSHLSRIADIGKQAAYVKQLHAGSDANEKAFLPSCFSDKHLEHYGIVPTGKPASLDSLTPQERQAYILIAKRYIQAFYPKAVIAVQEVEITVPVADMLGHPESLFKAKAERVVKLGWMEAFGQIKKTESTLQAARSGDLARLLAVDLKAMTTTPPPRFNDDTLLAAMTNVARTVRDPKLRAYLREAKGLGTPATRSTFIDTLLTRGYLARKGKSLISSPKGRDLIKVVPEWMSSPETTAVWEEYLRRITTHQDDAKAVAMRDKFVGQQIDRLAALIESLRSDMKGKISATPVFSSGGSQGPTKKMAEAARRIVDRQGIKAPRGLYKDFETCKAFLDQHLSKSTVQTGEDGVRRPTERMIEVARNIIQKNSLPAPEGVFDQYDACSQFLSAHLGNKPKSAKDGASPCASRGSRAGKSGTRKTDNNKKTYTKGRSR